MGTINFKTSKYITMGTPIYYDSDFENDTDFLAYCKEEYPNIPLSEMIASEIGETYNCDRINTETTLEKYDFHYFNITIEPGYYEGFSLLIELNPDRIIDYTDKRQANKEITKIKECLTELAGNGLQACFPGWCTGYRDYKETVKKEIPTAIKEMRKDIKETETDFQYYRRFKKS